MSRINTAVLIANATDVAYRANHVRQDPAVTKAAKQAWSDVKQASRSVNSLAQESQSAWRRAETRGR